MHVQWLEDAVKPEHERTGASTQEIQGAETLGQCWLLRAL